jgi:F0F1-type ATP synthase delta subunit
MKLKVPTELTDKQIEEFQSIYKKTFGKEISRDEAIEKGLSLIRFIALVIDNRKEHPNTKKKPPSFEG